jgi:hypothetical protein
MEYLFVAGAVGGMAGGGFSAYNSQQKICSSYGKTLNDIKDYSTNSKKLVSELKAYDINLQDQIFQNHQALSDMMTELKNAQDEYKNTIARLKTGAIWVVSIILILLIVKRLGYIDRLFFRHSSIKK